jgi:polysaccharide export outer membrane protein
MCLLTGLAMGAAAAEKDAPNALLPATPYRLGPEDALRITILEAPASSVERVLIDGEGWISLAAVGRLQAAGLSVLELEQDVRARFQRFIREPRVSVSLVEYRPQTVSVIGAVGKPGVHDIRGATPLVEVLSLAGGLRPDAGHRVRITRRAEEGRIPLPHAEAGPGGASVAELEIREVMEATGLAQNVLILPHDVITLPRARMVYVIGAVGRSGGFMLEEREHISAVQALALAGGTSRIAAPKRARILRGSGELSARAEIPVDLKGILDGRDRDIALQSDDILFVPTSGVKIAAQQAAQAALQIGTGIAIFAGGDR